MAKTIQPTAKPKVAKPETKDKFGLYVVIFVIFLLILFISYYLYTRAPSKPDLAKDYLSLPEMVISHDDEAVKLEITLQVDDKDRDWVEKNRSVINEIYMVTVQKFDPEMFRTKEGCEEIQKQLRDEINRQMNVTKIKAVYYKNLLIQHKE